MTDPPNVPSGVTAEYIFYSAISVHASGVSNDSGWYVVAGSGSVDLLKIASVSLTLGSASVTSGSFDLARFAIQSAEVTFEGSNYSCLVQRANLALSIGNSGVQVKPNSSSGFVIILSPTIIPFQNGTKAGFVLVTSAKSQPIPSQDWDEKLTTQGATETVNETSWGQTESLEASRTTIKITSVNISNNSLVVNVENIGTTNATLISVDILGQVSSGYPLENETSQSNQKSVIAAFDILSNGTLVEPNSFQEALSSGYLLMPNQNATLTFSGQVSLVGGLNATSSAPSILSAISNTLAVSTSSGVEATYSLHA